MSKLIELEILEAVRKRHLKRPLQYLCLEVSVEAAMRDLGYAGEVATSLRGEIMRFLNGEGSVEAFFARKRGVDVRRVSRLDLEVVAMRTHILKTMIARRMYVHRTEV